MTTDQAADGRITVLLPIHNRREVTERFVRALAAQLDQNFHLVLIDDGSTDGSADAVCSLLPGTTVVRGRGSWWWGGSLEQGRRWLLRSHRAHGDLVLMANANTVIGPEFLAEGRDAIAGYPRALLLAQLYRLSDGSFVEAGVHVDWRTLQFEGVADPKEINCLATRGLLMRTDDFLSVGRFHQRLLPHYGSDYEYTIRARNRGFALISDPKFKLWYDDGASGRRPPTTRSPQDFFHTTFSKRSVDNPFYWSTLILLACPPPLVPRNLIRVWRQFARSLLHVYRHRE